MTKLSGNRQFLGDAVPFLVGAYPNRVAPAHVFSGFLAAGLGSGPKAESISQFIRDASGTATPPDHLSNSIASDPIQLRNLAESLVTVLDPDRRVFASGVSSSPVPICPAIISKNPSDDRFGAQLGALCGIWRGDQFGAILEMYQEKYRDPLSTLGNVLNANHRPKLQDPQEEVVRKLLRSCGPLSRRYFEALADFVYATTTRRYGTLSAHLMSVARSVYFASFLAALRSPVFLAKKPKAWADVAPLFVYGARPPGNTRDPAARLAIRSYSFVISEVQHALGELLSERLAKSSGKVPKGLPRATRTMTWVKLAFPEIKQSVENELRDELKSVTELKNVRTRILNAVYPIDYLARAYRMIGRMLGIVGPDRGSGSPRFLLETPVLGILVESTLAQGEVLSFEEWVDRVYERFGIVIGFGREMDPQQLLKGLDRPGPLARAIKESQEALRLRLIMAGLAVEYSDGETEMVNMGNGHHA